jgi:hypothetical protein
MTSPSSNATLFSLMTLFTYRPMTEFDEGDVRPGDSVLFDED